MARHLQRTLTRSSARAAAVALVGTGLLLAGVGAAFAAVALDDFNRPDSTDLGPDWIETGGTTLEIVSGRVTNSTGIPVIAHSVVGAGPSASADVTAGVGTTNFVALLVGDDGAGEDYFAKVQDNGGDGIFESMGFYTGTNTGFVFAPLTTPFASGRITVSVAGSVVTLEIDRNFDDVVDETQFYDYGFTYTGTGVGFSVYGNASLDNFSSSLYATTTTASAEPVTTTAGTGSFDLAVASAGGTPTGSIDVDISGLPTQNIALVGGNATMDLSGLAIGSYTYSATYLGDSTFATSTVSGTIEVTAAATTTTLTASAGGVGPGANVTLTAAVDSVIPTPTGDVEFYDGATLLGTVPLSGGQAVWVASPTAVGPHVYSAFYVGTADYATSTGDVTVTVTLPATGADAAATGIAALGLILAGASLLGVARRRSAA